MTSFPNSREEKGGGNLPGTFSPGQGKEEKETCPEETPTGPAPAELAWWEFSVTIRTPKGGGARIFSHEDHTEKHDPHVDHPPGGWEIPHLDLPPPEAGDPHMDCSLGGAQ